MRTLAILDFDGVIQNVANVADEISESDLRIEAAKYAFEVMQLENGEGYPSMNVENLAAWSAFVKSNQSDQ